jgi:hypothetical protein
VTFEPDEELPQPRQSRGQRRALAGGAAILVLGALIARAIDKGHGPGNAHSSASHSATSPVAVSTPPLRLPSRTVGPPVSDCPSGAVCARTTGLPDPALEAVRGTFPSAVLVTGTSVLVQRPGRFDPDLQSRAFTVRAGELIVEVQLAKPSAGGRPDAGTHRVGARNVTFLDDFVPGFAVSISVSRPVGAPAYPLPPLERLAADRGLLAPE